MNFIRKKLDKDAIKKKSSNLLQKSFDAAACKTSLKMLIPRLKILKNKKEVQLRALQVEIAKCLETDREDSAKLKVEVVIKDEKLLSAYEMIDLYCEIIIARLEIIDSQKECPTDLKEAVAGVIYAQKRCSDLAELKDIRKHLSHKYGRDFAAAAAELRPGSGVSTLMNLTEMANKASLTKNQNCQLVEKLSIKTPNAETKTKALTKIAADHNIDWKPKCFEEEIEAKKTSLSGATTFESAGKLFPQSAKSDEVVQVVQKPEPVPSPVQVKKVPSRVSSNAESSSTGAPIISGNERSPPEPTPQKTESLNDRTEEQTRTSQEEYRRTAAAAAKAAAKSAELAKLAAIAAANLAANEAVPAEPQSEHDGTKSGSKSEKERRNRDMHDGRSSFSPAASSSEAISRSDLHPQKITLSQPSSPYEDLTDDYFWSEGRSKESLSRNNQRRLGHEKEGDDARDLSDENVPNPSFWEKPADEENLRVSQGYSVDANFRPATSPYSVDKALSSPTKSDHGFKDHLKPTYDADGDDYFGKTIDLENIPSSGESRDSPPPFSRHQDDGSREWPHISSDSRERFSSGSRERISAGSRERILSEPSDDAVVRYDDSYNDPGEKIDIFSASNWGERSPSPRSKPKLQQSPPDRRESNRSEIPYPDRHLQIPPARISISNGPTENLDDPYAGDEAKVPVLSGTFTEKVTPQAASDEDSGQQTLDLQALLPGLRNRHQAPSVRRIRRANVDSGECVGRKTDQVSGGISDRRPWQQSPMATRDDVIIKVETPRSKSGERIRRDSGISVPPCDPEGDQQPPRPRRRWALSADASDRTTESEFVRTPPPLVVKTTPRYSSSSTDASDSEMEDKEASKPAASSAANPIQTTTYEQEPKGHSSSSSSKEDAVPLASQSKANHVHPKLPNYDSVAKIFDNLRLNTRPK